MPVINQIKNRKIKVAMANVFPKTKYQKCIVYQIKNTLKFIPDKDKKAIAGDLNKIYQAPNEEKTLKRFGQCDTKKGQTYQNFMKCCRDNWNTVSPIFKFPKTV